MVQVIAQPTPNPQAYKFTLDGHTFARPQTVGPESAAGTPFEALFKLPGVASVFATANFVTVMKEPAADWGSLVSAAKAALEEAF